VADCDCCGLTDPPPLKWSALRYGSREPKKDGPMSRKRHKPEEIVSKLRQVDVLVAQGTPVADAVRSIGVTEVSCDRKLATALQYSPAACVSGLPTAGPGGVRARLRGRAGFAGQAPRSATTNHALTFNPDHSVGADHGRGMVRRPRAPRSM
jgi:hypothetical protein